MKQALENDVPAVFDYLEAQIAGREFLVGDRLTIADVAVVALLTNLAHAEVAIDAARWPSLAAYNDRIRARPSFANSFVE